MSGHDQASPMHQSFDEYQAIHEPTPWPPRHEIEVLLLVYDALRLMAEEDKKRAQS